MQQFRFNPLTHRFDLVDTSSSPTGDVQFLTGNSGGPVAPDGGGNIDIVGDSTIDVTGNPGTNTLTISVTNPAEDLTITGNTGGALAPTAGNWNIVGSGSITTSGAVSTLTAELTGLTNHNILAGAGTSTITKIPPSNNAGIPLISQGATLDPIFGTAAVVGGGTGVMSNTPYAVLCGGTSPDGAIQSIASVGTAGQVLKSNGAGALPTFQNGSSGSIIQYQRTIRTTLATCSTQLPFDDTIPQSGEGDEVMTVTITPTSASSILIIRANASGNLSNTTNNLPGMALFQDNTADALAAVSMGSPTSSSSLNASSNGTLFYSMTAGTTSATTFKIRCGCNSGSIFINGSNASRQYGGVWTAYIEVTEIQA